MEHQDWDPLVLRNKKKVGAAPAIGCRTIYVKRTIGAIAAAKIDAADGVVKPKLFTRESVLAIQEYRREQNLTQRGLDGRMGFPAGTMNKLEARSVAPTPTQLQSLNNLLRTSLTRD